MDLTNELVNRITKKIYLSKIRLLSRHGFFGCLLIGMDFVLVTEKDITINDTGIATDGETIYVNPFVVDKYSNEELDILIMHELLHIALKHCFRGKDLNKQLYNRACDIVVNSNIRQVLKEKGEIYIGEDPLEHVAPDGKEGYMHSAEEVYSLLAYNYAVNDLMSSGSSDEDQDSDDDSDGQSQSSSSGNSKSKKKKAKKAFDDVKAVDSHEPWSMEELTDYQEDLLDAKILKAAEMDALKNCGSVPLGVELAIKELTDPQIDWKEYLQSFIQENIVDYSFNPPDKRFSEGDLILPDFNEMETVVKNILFMVDTSGSMTMKEITACFSEINGAIQQFNGKLQGFLGFFDAEVQNVEEFDYDTDITKIIPHGGGGTDFKAIFKYIKDKMVDNPPDSVIILTDGYADWPSEEETMGLPILWIINNEDRTPPFGKVGRIKMNQDE